MEESILKAVINKSDWLIITVFVLYLAFQFIMWYVKNKKAVKTGADMLKQFSSALDSINNKLKVIYAQYGCELSKEAAILVIQNLYLNFANAIADETYELQKRETSHEKMVNNIQNRLTILNDEKMQDLDLFMYRNKHLITFTTGKIIDPEKIIKIINTYSNKNGMLREEIQNALSIESSIVIKRLN
jgi:hypothetical protein